MKKIINKQVCSHLNIYLIDVIDCVRFIYDVYRCQCGIEFAILTPKIKEGLE